MAKRRRDPESDGETASAIQSRSKAIFVSTSLDTHLAMTLSLSDTVADFTKKIMVQHEECFPEIGALTIHSLTVEHQGKMYRLVSDTVVSIAFEDCEGRWVLFVDASSSSEGVKEQNVLVPCNKDKLDNSRLPLAIDANAGKSLGECSQYSLEVGHVDDTLKSVENDLSNKDNSKNSKIQNEKLPLRKSYETRSGGGLNAKKKQKVKHSLDAIGESSLDATRTLPQTTMSTRSINEAGGLEDSIVHAGPKVSTSPQTTMSTRSNNEAGGLEDSVVHVDPKVSTDVQLGERDAEASPQNTMFSGAKTSEQAEPESHVFGKDAPSIQDSDTKTKSLEKSVAELKENMASPDVPSLQVQEEQPAISTPTKKKTKRKNQHQETKSSVPCDNAETSKPETVLQGSFLTEEACEGQILDSGSQGMVNDENLLTSTGNLQNIDNKEEQEEQPAISTGTKKKTKRKKQHQETNSSVPCDNVATSKPGTVLQGSVPTEEACEGRILDSGSQGMVNDESLLTSTGNFQNIDNKEDGRMSSEVGQSENDKLPDSVKSSPATRESVICLGMEDKFLEADWSKSKIKKSKKSAVRKLDQLDVDHDLSAPSNAFVAIEGAAHIEDQSSRDENVLPQNDLKKSEENSELAKNNVPGAVGTGRSNKDLDLDDERNLIEKESASDIAFNVRDDPEGGKSGNRSKKKKSKKPASKDRTKDANDPSALKSLSKYIPDDVMADQSIFSCIEGVEGPKMVSPTNSHKNGNGNGKTASDYDYVHFPLSEEHNQSRNEDLDLKSDSQDRAIVQGPVIMEHDKEAECPMDQSDGERKKKSTAKRKSRKKAKRAGNSTGDGLGIPEVNQENIGAEDIASLVDKSPELNYTDEKRTVDQSGVSELGLGKNSDLKGMAKSEQLRQNSEGLDVPAHEIESNREVIHATNNGLASDGENGTVNFRRYFVPGDDHIEAASPDKIIEESNAVEGAEKAVEQTIVPEGKQRPSKSSGNHKNSSGINTDAKSHERLSLKAKQSKSASERETSTNSRKRLKTLSTTGDANVKALKKSVDPARVTIPHRLKENNGSLISSNTKSVSSYPNKTMLNKINQKKQTGINIKNIPQGEISGKKVKDLDKSSQKKGLLTTQSNFFRDGSSESSGDENEKMKSGSSTQTPSYSMSSSSSSSEDLMREAGSNNKGRKTPSNSKLENSRNMPMDMIFKSSDRFKKAKLNASQSEVDSQQVDFVPETQPFD